jgi:RNA polymerase sigma-70 factor (ECF subfamily)
MSAASHPSRAARFGPAGSRSRHPSIRGCRAERAALAKRLIATLPERQQQILALRLIHQLGAAETGAALGMTEGSVRVAQHRALTTLRAQLREAT